MGMQLQRSLPSKPALTQPSTQTSLNANEWPLSALCVGDGSVSQNGRNRLEKGVFYTTGQAKGTHEQFHAEDRRWVSLQSVGFEEIRLPTYWVCRLKRKRVPAPTFVVPAMEVDTRYPNRSLIKRREYVACELFDFCDQYPGLAVVVSSLDYRESHPALKRELKTEMPPTLGAELSCLPASILNGLV